ncbi:uncharacterized protein LOC127257335 [Andrographis paniculata]|uniref:uncharacterized protein LOC127257335 n=1 Tax=Andrographis paniculata TaxID=175694 RepID=UPI0021E8E5AF|nr:uncharacterized protein LOC127257335 [Andrographis paniculata]
MPAAMTAEEAGGRCLVLGSAGNRVRVTEERRRKKEMAKKGISQSQEKPVAAAEAVLRSNGSANSSLESSSSSSGGLNVKSGPRSVIYSNNNGVVKAESVMRDESLAISPAVPLSFKRCDWITPNSEPLYTYFHDKEWGVPVHDDSKLFELLVLSQALAEHSWRVILSKRAVFRKLFEDFIPTSVANLDVGRLLSTRVPGGMLLSEPKVRAVVENAKQVLKIQQELGSFSNYCWQFGSHKATKRGFRNGRQVPVKSPKSEQMSKDLMKRGLGCVGATVVYSFMQVAGLVNDHLVTCFRYTQLCNKPHHHQDNTSSDTRQDHHTNVVMSEL